MSKEIDDGGLAFPVSRETNAEGYTVQWKSPGMTMRQWYAGMALSGLCAGADWVSGREVKLTGDNGLITIAWKMADLMIATEKKTT